MANLPVPNPIPNTGSITYQYQVDPSLPLVTTSDITNTVETQVNTADLDLTKAVDLTSADIGDTLTYTIVISNTGNVTANNVTVTDTIPNDTTFVTNSFTINGVAQPGENPTPPGGVNIGSIPAGGTVTVTFQVTVDTVPSPNPIPNFADAQGTYTVDPSIPDGATDRDTSNTVNTQVNNADLDLVKSASLDFADIGDTITYTIVLTNTGNVTATNVVFSDTIPNDTTFVTNSVTINGVTQAGANPGSGVNVPDIPAGGVTTITFQVTVDTVPSPNPIPNAGDAAWTYTVDPTNPNGASDRDTSNTVTTQVNNADLDLVKATSLDFADIGDTITYTIVLTNTGNVTATNVVFSDTIPNDTTFIPNSVTVNGVTQAGADPEVGVSIPNIPAGGVTTITFQVTVDTVPSPNPIPNAGDAAWTYTVDPTNPDGASDRDTSNTVTTQVNNADLDLVKAVDLDEADIGDTLTYTIVLVNTGNVTATNVVFIDTIPNDTTFVTNSVTINGVTQAGANPESGVNVPSIPAGGVTTITFQVTVDTIPSPNPIPNSGDAAWTYTVDPTNPDGASDRDTSNTVTTQVSNADLDLVKAVDLDFADIGDTITYTIVIANAGNVSANNVVFSDTIPNDTTFIPNSVTVNGVTQAGANPQTGVSIGTILPGGVATVTFQVTVDTVPSPNPIPNAGDAAWTYTVDPANPNGESGRDTSNTVNTQVNNADLDLVKSTSLDFADIGDTITYTVVLTNTGNVTATNVMFSDTIPNDTTFVANSVTINGVPQAGANPGAGFSVPDIPAGGVTTITFQVTVDTVPSPNPITNFADTSWTYTVDPANPDGASDRDTSNTVTTQVNNADLDLVKAVDLLEADIGDTLTYTIVLTNTGNVVATNVVFSDTIPNDTTFVPNSVTINGTTQAGANPETGFNVPSIPAGGVTTITFQVTVDTVPSPNPIPNAGDAAWTYTVDPANPNGASDRDTSNTVTTQVSNADLDLVKSVNLDFADIGDTLTYTIVITNSGNVTANNVTFTDTIPNDTTFVNNSVTVNGVTQAGANPESGVSIGSISPGGVATITFQVTVDTVPSPNPIPNAGDAAWTYTVDPANPDGESGRDTSNTVTTQVNNADLDLVKSTSLDFADTGDTITYTVVLTNTGNVTATNVQFTDTIPNDTTFVTNSVTINGAPQAGANPGAGFSVPDIPAGGVTTITFQVTVDTVPSPNPIQNFADSSWTYTVDPANPDGASDRDTSNTVTTQVNNADLDLVKSTSLDFADIGDTITYTVVLSNTGNVTATNVQFTDTIPNDTTFVTNSVTINGAPQAGANPGAGFSVPDIPAGGVTTITFQVTVDTVPSPNPIPNFADSSWTYTVDPANPDGASDRDTSNTVTTQVNNADLDLVKAVDLDFADIGDTITYTIVLTNTGNVTATNVQFTDTIPNDATFVTNSVTINGAPQAGADPEAGFSVPDIPAGGVTTITFQVTVDTVPSPNPIPNFADTEWTYTVDPANPDGASDRDTSNTVTTQVNNADLDLVKAVDRAEADIGDTLTYTIVLTNTGNVAATNVVFSDTIPNDTTFITNSVTINGVPQLGANPQTGFNVPTIPGGGVTTITFQVTVDTVPSPNPIPNSGDAEWTYTVDPANPDGASDRDTSNTVTTQVNNADLDLVKAIDLGFADIGDTLTYTIVITNTGNVTSNNVVFTDTIPNDTTFVTDSVTLNGAVQAGVNPETGVNVGTIAPGGVSTITFQVTVDTVPSPNPIPNFGDVAWTYTVDPSVPDGASDRDTSNTVTTQINNADLDLVKIVSSDFADIGDTITFTILLTNTGNVIANNVQFTDTIPNDTTFVTNSVTINGVTQPGFNPETGFAVPPIPAGGVTTVTFQVTVDTIPSPNPIPNTANANWTYTVDPSVPNGASDSDSSNTTETQINNADLDLVKTASSDFADIGDTITFTIVLTNTGNVTANNVQFTDTIPNDTTFVNDSVTVNGSAQPGANPETGFTIPPIPAGGVTTVTFQVTVDTIPSPNPIQNTANADWTYTVDPSVPDGGSGTDSSNTAETQINNADLDLVKSVDFDFVDIGDTITYTIVLTNTGNVAANNIVFSDTIPNDTTFVANSVTINGAPQAGANPGSGINVPSIPGGGVTTITFQVTVDTVPSPNPIPNFADAEWTYTVDPSVPNGASDRDTSNTVTTQVNNADLDLVKSTDLDFADIGDTITYTVVLTNTGNVSATNVVFSDTIPNDTTFVTDSVTVNGVTQAGANPQSGVSIPDIPGGGVTTITFQVTVDTVPSPNPIPNFADSSWTYTVDPANPDGASDRDTSNTVTTQVGNADISITKAVDLANADIGDTLTYTIVLSNPGNVTANNVNFTDTIPNVTTFVSNSVFVNGTNRPGDNPQSGVNVGSIVPNGVTTITFQVTVDTIPSPNPIPNFGDVNWTYTIDPSLPDGESGRNTSNTANTRISNAQLSIVKSVDSDFADIGDVITYTLVLSNSGNVNATNILVTDTIPNDTTFVTDSVTVNGAPQPGVNPQSGITVPSIIPGGTATVQFRVTVYTIPSPNPIPNFGDVNWTYTVDPSVPDGASDRDTSNTVDTQVNNADLAVTKAVDKGFADVGETITYTIVLRNTGNVAANNVTVTDTIPNDTTFVSNSVTVNGSVQGGSNPETGITVGTISAGGTATITFQVTVDTIPTPNPIPNFADAAFDYTVDPADPNGSSNRRTTNTVNTQVNNGNLEVEKLVDVTNADIGDTITYSVVVRNIGNVPVNNTTVTDTIPSGTSFVNNSVFVNGSNVPGANPATGVNIGVLNAGATATVTFRVTVDTIPSPNPIINFADANGTYTVDPSVPNGGSDRDTSNEVETQINNADINIVKAVDKSFATVGDTLTYTILLNNNGNVDATGVSVTDTIPAGTSFVTDSVTIDGVVQPGANPQSGISVGVIGAGDFVTVTFQVIVDTIPTINPIPNSADVSFNYTVDTPNDSSGRNNSNTVFTQINNADTSVTKSVDLTTANVGDTLTYTINISNPGNVTANNVVITDTIPNDTTFVTDSVMVNNVTVPGANPETGVSVGNIGPGGTATVKFQVTIDTLPSPNPIPNSAVSNFTFTVDPSVPNGASNSRLTNEVNTQVNNGDLNIVKSVDKEFADLNDTLTYTIVVSNPGNVVTNNILVTDTIPNGTSFVSGSVFVNATNQAGANPQSGISVGSLNPGGVATITFQVTIDTIPSPNPIPNSAFVDFTYTVDPNNPNGERGRTLSNEVDTQLNNADINIVKAVDKVSADVGDTITYTITLGNTGNVDATNVIFSDSIPNDTTFVPNSVTINGSVAAGANPDTGVTIGTITPGSTVTITFQVIVDRIPAPNPIPNRGTATFNYTIDPNFPNGGSGVRESNEVNTQVNNATISNEAGGLNKSVDKVFARVGDTLTYTIILTNTGNVPANNVVLTDTVPNDTTFVNGSVTVDGITRAADNPETGINLNSINPGQTVTVTFEVVVDTIPSPNPIPNQGIVNYQYNVDQNTTVMYTQATNIVNTQVNEATLSNFRKAVDRDFADVGDTLTYTITATNDGNVPAENVVITDMIPNDTTFVADSVTIDGVGTPGVNPENGINLGTIEVGDTRVITFQVVIDTIPNPNPIPNAASVEYTFQPDPDAPPVTETGNTNTVETQVNNANISNESGGLIKSVDKINAAVGETLTYTTILRNTGNVPANNVVFTDTIPNDTTFVAGSVVVNGVVQAAANPATGINIGTINPAQVVTITFEVTIDRIPNPNPIPNTSNVTYEYTVDPDNNPITANNNSNQVLTVVSNADISGNNVRKAVDKTTADIGEELTYTITLTNSGNTTANNVILIDTIPNDTTFITGSVTINGSSTPGADPAAGINIGMIGPNDTADVTFRVTIDTIPSPNPIPNQGLVNYTFTSDPNDPDGNGASGITNVVNTLVSNADININKLVDKASANVGDTLTYTIVLSNPGNVNADNVVLTDTIPNDTTFVENSVTINGAAQPGENPAAGINIGSLAGGTTTTITFRVVVDRIPTPNPIPNVGVVDFTYTVDPSIPDGETGTRTSNEVTTQINNANISTEQGGLRKSVDKNFADVGDIITYTITLENTGNVDAQNVTVSDTIPNDTTFVSGSVTVDGAPRVGDNPKNGVVVGTIAPGQIVLVTFQVRIERVPTPNPIPNTADVSYSYIVDAALPPVEERNTTNEVETQVNNATIDPEQGDLVKSVDRSFATVGDTLTYTISIRNSGNVVAENVVLDDPIPSGTSLVQDSVTVNGVTQPGVNPALGVNVGNIAPGATATVTFQVVVDEIPNPNPIPNTADVTFEYRVDPDSTPIVDTVTSNEVNTQVNQASLDDFRKAVDKEFADIGEVITYTVSLTNNGNVVAENVVLIDTIPNDTTFVPNSVTVNGVTQPGANPQTGVGLGNIDPGETGVMTFQVTVDTIPDPNPIQNSAFVNFTFRPDPNLAPVDISGTSNVVETLVRNATISTEAGGLLKEVDKEFADVDEIITYTITLRNTGNVDAENVVLRDPIPKDTEFIDNSVLVNGASIPGENPGEGIDIGTIAPGATVIVVFRVRVVRIPDPNPIPNVGNVTYEYTVDPDNSPVEDSQDTNEVNTQVNNADISGNNLRKTVDRTEANIGTILSYFITFKNTGNVPAQNVVLIDTIPNDTTFVADSVTVDGVQQPGANPQTGINIGTVQPDQDVVVFFQVTVDRIPNPNPIPNTGILNYEYTVDPNQPNVTDSESTNTVETNVSDADLEPIVKAVDKEFADIGDVLNYTLMLINNGNTNADNVVVTDTIPNDTTFVPDSVKIDGIEQPGVNPQNGIPIGTVAPGESVNISFQVTIDTIPEPNPIPNVGNATFTFIVGDETIRGSVDSNEVETLVRTASLSGAQKIVDRAFADVGETLTYTITIRNGGNEDAINVVLTDAIPNDTTFVENSVTVGGIPAPGENPGSGINIGTIPSFTTTTVSFQVVIDRIPSPNPIPNFADVSFEYIVNPDEGPESGSVRTNTVQTQVNNADIDANKSVDQAFADIEEELVYTITVANNGNSTATNVIVFDTIPNDTSFVENSVSVNGSNVPGANPEAGINVGIVGPGSIALVTFRVFVETIPSPNPIPNTARTTFSYRPDPTLPPINGEEITDTVETQINHGEISFEAGGLLKAVDKEFADVGETITYTITLRNTGNVDVNDVVLTDTIPQDTTFVENSITVDGVNLPGENPQAGVSIGTIAPNQTVTVTFMVVVDRIPDPNPIPNFSRVNYSYIVDPEEPPTTVANRSNTVETQVNTASISTEDGGLLKQVDKEFAKIGDTLSYTITLTNTGNVNAENVVVRDVIPNGTTFVPGSVLVNGFVNAGANPEMGVTVGTLAPNDTATVIFQVVVNEIPTPNPIPNSANVTYEYNVDPQGAPVMDSQDTNIVETEVRDADITPEGGGLSKTVDKEDASIGDTLTYTVSLTNTGNVDANDVVLRDFLPEGTSLVAGSLTVGGVPNNSNPEVGIPIGTIAPNQTVLVEFQVVVVAIPENNPIENTAEVNYNFVVDPEGEPEEETGVTTSPPTEISVADLSPSRKSVDKDFADVDDVLTYTITVENSGNVTANNVVVTDPIPNGTEFIENSVSVGGSIFPGANPENGVNIGSVGPGETIVLTFQVRVLTIPDPNPIENIASISYEFNVGDETRSRTDNTNPVDTEIRNANISNEDGGFVKSVDLETATVGDTLTYTLRVENTGNINAENVVVTDPIPNGTMFVPGSLEINGGASNENPSSGIVLGTVPPNSPITITFQVVVVELPEDNPIQNTANVSYEYSPNPNEEPVSESNDSNTVETTINFADITGDNFNKSVDRDAAAVGEVITYTITASNSGNVPAENVVITDPIPAGTAFIPGSVSINGTPDVGATPDTGIFIGTINPSETAVVTFQVRAVSIPDPNPTVNQATIDYQYTVEPGRVIDETETTDEIPTTINDADLSPENGGFIKSSDPEFADIGDTITFTFTLTNKGNVDALDVVVTDTIPEATSFVEDSVTVRGMTQPGINPEDGIPVGTISPNEVVLVTFKVVVETIPSPNPIVNQGTLTYNFIADPDRPPIDREFISNETETQVNNANLENATKDSNLDFVKVGDTITYTIVIPNTGNVTAENVVVTDSIPGCTSFVANSVRVNNISKPGESLDSGITVGNISPGQVATVTYQLTVTCIPPNDMIENTATISYEYRVDPEEPPTQKEDMTNTNEVEVRDANISPEDGGFIKSVDPEFAQVGETVTYTIKLMNTGNVPAEDVFLADPVPPETEFVVGSIIIDGESKPSENPSDGIEIGNINPNQTVTVTFEAVVTELPEDGVITNVATVSYEFIVDPNEPPVTEENNSNEVDLVINSVDFTGDNFVKSADPEFAALGDTITYSFFIRNGGNADANSVVFTDQIPTGTVFVEDSVVVNGTSIPGVNPESGINLGTISPNEVINLSFQVVVTSIPEQNPIENMGRLDYTVIVDPNQPPVPGTDESNMEEVQINSADVVIEKVSDKSSAVVGDTLTYTITVENRGNVDATDVVITDQFSSSLQFVQGSVVIDGEMDVNADLISGVNIGTVSPGQTVTIQYQAVLISRPEDGVATNMVNANFQFIVDPNEPPRNGNSESNENEVVVEIAELIVEKTVNKQEVVINETVTYTVTISNTGTVDAINVIFRDDLPSGLQFVEGSFKINGTTIGSADVEVGVNIGTVAVGETVTVMYDAIVRSAGGPCSGGVTNSAFVDFTFITGSDVPPSTATSEPSSVTLKVASPNFKELILSVECNVPECNPPIEDINDINIDIEVLRSYVINTIIGKSTSNQTLTGNKLIINGKILADIEYTSCDCRQSVYSLYCEERFSTFIILTENVETNSNVDVDVNVENVDFTLINERRILLNITTQIDSVPTL